MSGIGGLLLLWIMSRAGGGALIPSWPTPASPPPPAPPPPMPPAPAGFTAVKRRKAARPAATLPSPDGPMPSPDRAPPTSAVTPGVTPTMPPAALDRGVTVADAQRVLLAIEPLPKNAPKSMRKSFSDGLYGPKTRGAWAHIAGKRGLDPLFERIDGKHATVAIRTWEVLRAEAARSGTVVGMYIP